MKYPGNPSSSFNELVLTGTTYMTVNSFADYGFVTITDTSVPEPSTIVLLGVGLIGGRWLRKK